jgi:hypothetical protein
MKYREESIQIAVSDYLKLQYPNTVFTFEASGANKSIAAAAKAKRQRSERGLPDLLIFNPSPTGLYCALFLELKKEGTSIICKTGTRKGELVADEHIYEQYACILKLRTLGHWADFAVGFDQAKETIDKYFNTLNYLTPNYLPVPRGTIHFLKNE